MRPLNPVEIEQGCAPKYTRQGREPHHADDLERYGAGLICLAGGARSPLALALTRGDDPRALCDRLGANLRPRQFLYRSRTPSRSRRERLNRRLAALAATSGVPLVATNDVCHTGADRALLDALTCIRLGLTLEEAGRALWANAERRLNRRRRWRRCFAICPARSPPRVRSPSAAGSSSATRLSLSELSAAARRRRRQLSALLVEAGARERWGGARCASARPARARARSNRAA